MSCGRGRQERARDGRSPDDAGGGLEALSHISKGCGTERCVSVTARRSLVRLVRRSRGDK